ncbi:UNVERIFIED_CONTAM: hypothetical protein FKN15_001120 [Acipenser sinensis]
MAGARSSEWKQKCEMIWKLKQRKVPAPDSVDWKTVFEKKPIERNLIKSPAPEGLSHTIPPPKHEFGGMMGSRPPQFEPEGDFTGWKTSREDLPLDSSGIPPGAVVCHLPNFSWFTLEQRIDLKGEGLWEELLDVYQPDISIQDCWFTLEQRIDLKGEGLWEELLDVYQPDISIQDWYEDSKLHEEVYQLQVRLLGADGQTVIQEFKLNPKNDTAGDPERWLETDRQTDRPKMLKSKSRSPENDVESLKHWQYPEKCGHHIVRAPQPIQLPEVERPLCQQVWFHGALSRQDAEWLLQKEGDFLVREGGGRRREEVVLSVRSMGGWKHVGGAGSMWEGLGGAGSMWEGLGACGRDWEGLEACGRGWEHVGGTGRGWKHVGGAGSMWEGLGGAGSMWEGLGACGRDWEGLEACGRGWEHVGGTGRGWKHVGGAGSMWEGLGGAGSMWEGLGACGRDWEGLEACGRGWEHVGGTGRGWKHVGGAGSMWEGLGGAGSMWEGLGACGRDWEGLEACGRVWEHVGGAGRDWEGLEACGRDWKPVGHWGLKGKGLG